MPYVRIEITDGATTEQKLELYKGVTDLLVKVLGKNPEYTFVVIEEVAGENWGHKGTSVALIRKAEAEARAKSAKAPAKKASEKAPGKKAGVHAVPEAGSLKKGPAKK
jgi:4-oxalocrotonate tautomerase